MSATGALEPQGSAPGDKPLGMPFPGTVRLAAPAKLTTSLRVLGRSEEGLHLLQAEMVTVDLHDLLIVDPAASGLSVEVDPRSGVPVPSLEQLHDLARSQENLVRRALAAVGRSAGVRLVKRIPMGGGLGGGSADAAAILRWAGCQDTAVALALGSDVPFCVTGGRAVVGGVGERIDPLAFEERSYVLLVPPFGVATAAVYRAWDELGTGSARDEEDGPNDLTAAAIAVEPRLGRWRDLLAEATGRRPVLAGSGATWYIEGTADDVGLAGRTSLVLGHEKAALIAVRSVPCGWEPAVPDAG
ncbi:MAG: 4-(cytidine 5'-diphospho)-2-C-methyl-D-erythritol kinase [Actinomycetota bacterium]|jgi:4-diphosphocytidyl-2-C-methyl-D-erythritol kinase|nr:4-(cytidine 5'-diphospho)-2-C-methyl-D-erythritol kinase [Actinomycetota bacterium]